MSRVPEFNKMFAILRTWVTFVPHYILLLSTVLAYLIAAQKPPKAYLIRWKNYLPFLDCKWVLDKAYNWADFLIILIACGFITLLFSKSVVFFVLFGMPTIYHVAIADLDDPNK